MFEPLTQEGMIEKTINAKTVVVFDLETTGLSPAKAAEILEIGALELDVEQKKFVNSFSALIKPRNGKVPKSATEANGITTEMVADARYMEEVLPQFYNFIKGKILVGHNCDRFDVKFLEHYFAQVGYDFTNTCIDTLKLDKLLHPEREKHTLGFICESMGHPVVNAHRAVADVKFTASVFLRLRKELMNNEKQLRMAESNVSSEEIPKDADLSGLRIGNVAHYKYKDKRRGRATYFNCNIGTVFYNGSQKVWGLSQKRIPGNIDMEKLKLMLLTMTGLTEEKMEKLQAEMT